MPPPDKMFPAFLAQMPMRMCLNCLTAVYAASDTAGTLNRLDELGDAIEGATAKCGNCERHTMTYWLRRRT